MFSCSTTITIYLTDQDCIIFITYYIDLDQWRMVVRRESLKILHTHAHTMSDLCRTRYANAVDYDDDDDDDDR